MPLQRPDSVGPARRSPLLGRRRSAANGAAEATEGQIANFDLRFKPYLAEHGRVHYRRLLDIGGGRAGYGLLYRQLADEVYVCDLNDCAASYAQTGIRFLTADVTRGVPLPDRSFDIVVSHSAFEHIDGVPAAIAEVDRLLRPRGHAFITIRPLYYSALGFHRRDWAPWAHLSAAGPEEQVPDGHRGSFLNKLTYAEMLGAVGAVGWRVLDFTPKYNLHQDPPAELLARYSEVDLRGMEFFGLFEKLR